MNENLRGVCAELKALSGALKVKKECEEFFRQTEEKYIKRNVKLKEPVLKQGESAIEPAKPNFSTCIILTLLAEALSIALIFFLHEEDYFDAVLFFFYLGIAFLPIVGGVGIFYAMKRDYKEKVQRYEEIMQENEKINRYNANEYPVLLKAYEQEVLRCKESFVQTCDEYKEKKEVSNHIIEKYVEVIAPKFYDSIDEIIGIIEDGRADSLKEALNIFVSDTRQNDLVKAQQERNRIAEQQMWDAQRHNREMETQAKRQADAIKQQEEARRRGAPNCWQCKNWPCGGDPAYCGSFAKKD